VERGLRMGRRIKVTVWKMEGEAEKGVLGSGDNAIDGCYRIGRMSTLGRYPLPYPLTTESQTTLRIDFKQREESKAGLVA